VTLSYRAWDRTQGTAGGTLTTVGNQGGKKSMSTAAKVATLTVSPVNDAPKLVLGGTIGYVHDAAKITLAASAAVSDIDSDSFVNGRLRVRITTGASASNVLAIGGAFTVDGERNVVQDGKVIGTLNAGGGQGTTDLVVTFKPDATPSAVQALVRAITFKTVAGSAGTRDVVFFVTDGDGGISEDQTKTVHVT
jgi:hypothetical protein